MQSGFDRRKQKSDPPVLIGPLQRIGICLFLLSLSMSFSSAAHAAGKTLEEAYYERAQALIKRNSYDEAAKLLLPICRKHPHNVDLLMELGDCYLKDTTNMADSARQAEECFTKAIKLDPELGRAYCKMTECASFKGKHELAVKMATKALSVKRPDNQAYMERADAYSRLHKDKEALADMDKFIALGNRTKLAYLRRASILESLRLYARAASDYRIVQKTAFETNTAYLEANCLDKINKTKEAITCLTELITRYPEDDSAYEGRAKLRAKSGLFKEAIDDYTKAIQLVPSSAVLKARAHLYEKMGRKDLAAKDRKEAERI